MNDEIKIIFTGFESEKQAKAFAGWFEGSGEQDVGYWMEEHSNITNVETNHFINKLNKNNEIIIPLKLYKRGE